MNSMGTIEFVCADVVEWARCQPAESFHACLTDCPYGIEFMSMQWDSPDAANWQSGGGFSKPGIGERQTARPSYSSTQRFGGANPTCAKCGGRARGAKECECKTPDWKPIGKCRNPENEALSSDVTAGYRKHLAAYQQRCETWAREIYRLLKPGGYIITFGGTRTWHRLACALEDAGFECRDTIQHLSWNYGSGFPKSLSVGKSVRKQAGIQLKDKFESAFDSRTSPTGNKRCNKCGKSPVGGSHCRCQRSQDEPDAELCMAWHGHGTALKPSWEPILVFRKPLDGSVARNCVKHGSGSLNIDAARIRGPKGDGVWGANQLNCQSAFNASPMNREYRTERHSSGRWPANVVLCHTEICEPAGQTKVKSDGHHSYKLPADGGLYKLGLNDLEDKGNPHADVDGTETVSTWRCAAACWCGHMWTADRLTECPKCHGIRVRWICPVAILRQQSGKRGAAAPVRGTEPSNTGGENMVCYGRRRRVAGPFHGDEGFADRFFFTGDWSHEIAERLGCEVPFRYVAKANKRERSNGLAEFYWMRDKSSSIGYTRVSKDEWVKLPREERAHGNVHCTVKPISLCIWLAKLLSPPARYAPRRLLVPFSGSGSEAIAALMASTDGERHWDEIVAIEREPGYVEIARARETWWRKHPPIQCSSGQTAKSPPAAVPDTANQQPELLPG